MKRLLVFASSLLTGCNRNPNVEIVGSYFPGWMVCLFCGVALTTIAHGLLRRAHAHHRIGHPALVYPPMLILFTCTLWLLLFS